MLKHILDRLKEPSSHAGIALILLAAGYFFPEAKGILDAVAAAMGGSAILTPESKY